MKYFLLIAWVIVAASCKRHTTTETLAVADSVKVEREHAPEINLFAIGGDTLRLGAIHERTILILFAPDCDHCQREATEISKHQELFKDYKLYFVAADQPPVIKGFSEKYGLSNWPNATFARGDIAPVMTAFKPTTMPAILIYDDHGFLVKRFDGETPVLNIVEFL